MCKKPVIITVIIKNIHSCLLSIIHPCRYFLTIYLTSRKIYVTVNINKYMAIVQMNGHFLNHTVK